MSAPSWLNPENPGRDDDVLTRIDCDCGVKSVFILRPPYPVGVSLTWTCSTCKKEQEIVTPPYPESPK